jgi:hypothetical protein
MVSHKRGISLLLINIILGVLGIAVLFGSAYSLITGEYGLQPYLLLLMGLMNIVLGIKVFHENQKGIAILLFIASGFVLIVSIFILIG